MKKFLIALIDFYRHQISPYKGGRAAALSRPVHNMQERQ